MADIFIPDTSELMTTEEGAYTVTPADVTFVQLTAETKRSVDMFIEISGIGSAKISNTSAGTISQSLPSGTRMGLGRGHMLDSIYFSKATALDAPVIKVIGAMEEQP